MAAARLMCDCVTERSSLMGGCLVSRATGLNCSLSLTHSDSGQMRNIYEINNHS